MSVKGVVAASILFAAILIYTDCVLAHNVQICSLTGGQERVSCDNHGTCTGADGMSHVCVCVYVCVCDFISHIGTLSVVYPCASFPPLPIVCAV
jgi:hypothetical protein